MATYKEDEIKKATLEYFKGDELATNVWLSKYALRDNKGNIYEKTPDDMHHRLAKELARIEAKYIDPLSEDTIYNVLKGFKYIIPQGSPMAGIGNNHQIMSLSNCFVIGNQHDSYGGVLETDQEQIQMMKRRGGVGHDLSHLRPFGTPVLNAALTSSGMASFMERYSNSTREVAQEGRRGALMLTVSIKHPDAERFIDAKLDMSKVTGANVSVRVDDEFMKAVVENKKYRQQFPVDSSNPTVVKEIDAQQLWKKIIKNAWKSAEPGVLFWDTISREAIPDCYGPEWKTTSTNPCGEIPLCPYDSCRLTAINLYSYVKNPFAKTASFDWDLFRSHVRIAQRIMDDIVDIEIEKINNIIGKIQSDPEPEHIKHVEITLWKKILKVAIMGRRTGLGVTGEGDMLAALNLRYGSETGNKFAASVHRTLAIEAYRSSVEMATERGPFPVYNSDKEVNNPFVKRIADYDQNLYQDMISYGRRNIALLTIAPTGTLSILTQTSSGIEPVFLPAYTRRRKVNSDYHQIDFVDGVGDCWTEYNVFHHGLLKWMEVNGYDIKKKYSKEEVDELILKSPYYKATANDVDYIGKVILQGDIQKWVDHSISCTINMPNSITEEMVDQCYVTAWKSGCKGVTVYRDGCRSGVLIAEKKKEVKMPIERPKTLKADVVRFTNKDQKWIAFIGLIDGRPYEIFTGSCEGVKFVSKTKEIQTTQTTDNGVSITSITLCDNQDVNPCTFEEINLDTSITSGEIVKVEDNGSSRYDFVHEGVTIKGLSRMFNREYWNYARLISNTLRHGMPIENVVEMVEALHFEGSINTWRHGVARALRKYVADGTEAKKQKCDKCLETTLVYSEGCLICKNCGTSKCN